MNRPLDLVRLLDRVEAAHVHAGVLARSNEAKAGGVGEIAHVLEEIADVLWKLVEIEMRRS